MISLVLFSNWRTWKVKSTGEKGSLQFAELVCGIVLSGRLCQLSRSLDRVVLIVVGRRIRYDDGDASGLGNAQVQIQMIYFMYHKTRTICMRLSDPIWGKSVPSVR